MGVDIVFDMNSANDLTLIAAAHEFVSRYKEAKLNNTLPLTLLASACPGPVLGILFAVFMMSFLGWICYVEKTHGHWCIPYLAKTRSTQATMGKILKMQLCSNGIRPSKLYHCTIMSCFDKKLEASRSHFLASDGTSPEVWHDFESVSKFLVLQVDACLTSTEMVSLIEDNLTGAHCFKDYGNRDDVYLDALDGGRERSDVLYGVPGSSGGLLEYIFRTAAKRLFNKDVPDGPVPMRTLRNSNFKASDLHNVLSVKRSGLAQEVTLDDDNGQPLLRFASAYGFRNIQTLVQKIKRKQCPYDYVEVMACPSGCVNGGGQPKHSNIDPKELLSKIETIHTQVDTVNQAVPLTEVCRMWSCGIQN